MFANEEFGVQRHLCLLDQYISRLPPKPLILDSYMKPLGNHVVDKPSKPWHSSQLCGENKLTSIATSMFLSIGFTNVNSLGHWC